MVMSTAFVRFLLSGGFNTAVTYVLYLGLLQFLPYWFSYTLTFSFGVALAYVLSRYFIFGAPGSERRVFLFPVIYFLQYLAGLLIVLVWVDLLGWNPAFAPLASIAVTVPATFIFTKWVFSASDEKTPRTMPPTESSK